MLEESKGVQGGQYSVVNTMMSVDSKRDALAAKNNPAHSTRPPSINELKLFTPWLWAELRIVCPSFVLCLGRAAAKAVIETDIQMDKDHGLTYKMDGFIAMATYHPAYVLRWGNRRDGNHTMRMVIEDMTKIAGLYQSVGRKASCES